MVDFQSRETRRGSLTADESDEETPANGDPADEDHPAEHADETETPAAGEREVKHGIAVITVGGEDDAERGDPASEAVVSSLERAGETVVARERADATYDSVQGTVDRMFGRRNVGAIVTVRKVGIGPSDVTVEAVEPLLEKRMPGFGELFRVQYFDHVGPAVVGMRPLAGVGDGVPVFCLPGEADAARFAVETILAEMLETLVTAASGGESGS